MADTSVSAFVQKSVFLLVFKYVIWSDHILNSYMLQLERKHWVTRLLHSSLLSQPLYPCPPLMWISIDAPTVHPVTENVFLQIHLKTRHSIPPCSNYFFPPFLSRIPVPLPCQTPWRRRRCGNDGGEADLHGLTQNACLVIDNLVSNTDTHRKNWRSLYRAFSLLPRYNEWETPSFQLWIVSL